MAGRGRAGEAESAPPAAGTPGYTGVYIGTFDSAWDWQHIVPVHVADHWRGVRTVAGVMGDDGSISVAWTEAGADGSSLARRLLFSHGSVGQGFDPPVILDSAWHIDHLQVLEVSGNVLVLYNTFPGDGASGRLMGWSPGMGGCMLGSEVISLGVQYTAKGVPVLAITTESNRSGPQLRGDSEVAPVLLTQVRRWQDAAGPH